MGQAEILIAGLLVVAAGLSALARRLAIPYPSVLVIGGALVGFVPGLPEVRLDPEVVLVVFLPPLVYGAAFFANLVDTKANIRSTWGAAFALGAVVSPTDPLAGSVDHAAPRSAQASRWASAGRASSRRARGSRASSSGTSSTS